MKLQILLCLNIIRRFDYMAMADSVWYENVTEYCLETHLVSYVFVML